MTPSPIPAYCHPTSMCALWHTSPWGVTNFFALGMLVGIALTTRWIARLKR